MPNTHRWHRAIRRATQVFAAAALAVAVLPARFVGAAPVMAAAPSTPALHGIPASARAAYLRSPSPDTARPSTRAPRVAPPCSSQFSVVPGADPGSFANVIFNNAMAAISATDVWAVGGQASSNTGPDTTLVDHWDGSTWSNVGSPNVGTSNNDFWGVTTVPGAASALNNVWAVGTDTDTFGVEHPIADQWNGSGWTQATMPANVTAGDNRLTAAAALASNDIWAVGFAADSNTAGAHFGTLTEHYNGTAWSTVTGVSASMTSSDEFLDVAGTATNDVWAVGHSRDLGVASNLIAHWNGTSWSVVMSPNQGATSNTLYSVQALSTTNAWAVGDYADAAGRHHTSILHWDGTTWSAVASPSPGAGTYDSYLFSVSAPSATDIWAGGAVYSPTSTGGGPPSDTLVEHYDGSSWTIVASPDGASGRFNEINAILATSHTNVWAGGDYINSADTQDLTLFENLCIAAPTVTGVAPVSGNSGGGTTVAITGSSFNFASGVNFGATPATSFTVNSNVSITATAPAGSAGTVDVTVVNPAGTSATSTADTYIYVPPAVSWQQYRLNGNDGSTWVAIDPSVLTLSFTPSVDSNAILSGNADLWTSLAGVNQDVGIFISGGTYGVSPGTLAGWKESGGNAGTFSPNAAFVQTVTPVKAATTYTVTLDWKANHATNGAIFTAAGVGTPFSPTRLTAELVPATDLDLKTAVSTSQYTLTGAAGNSFAANWQDMDATNLAITSYTPSASGSALVSVNADLWTQNAGVNQDVGIFISGGAFGSGQTVGWKESGGNAGVFSPNAAYAQAVVSLAAATPYTIKVQWKANHATTGTIRAAAGAGPTVFSPTRLTVRLYAADTGIQDAASNLQYHKANSTGSDWTPIDSGSALTLSITPASDSIWALEGNADLWTANAGVNQDIGIVVSGGAYGSGTLVGWKESGGFAGTFSPNAAFVQTVIPLKGATTYTVVLEWKANHATIGTIYAAAGAGPAFSPTRLTARTLG